MRYIGHTDYCDDGAWIVLSSIALNIAFILFFDSYCLLQSVTYPLPD